MKKLKITKENKADLQAEYINYLVKDLFNGVSVDDVLKMKGMTMFYKGVALSPAQKLSLVNGAKSLKALEIWQVLLEEMKNVASKRILETSKTIEDIVFGKVMLYVIDVMEKKIENLANLR